MQKSQIRPEMTILEVISLNRRTEQVFRKYDQAAGVCLCCQALFDSLAEVAQNYRLNLEQLLAELESVINISCETNK
ncbi:MAG: hypothetical protein PHW74_02770 [Desulfobacca sp.]|nr:hypothetical protein [Desulfobacca sp.]